MIRVMIVEDQKLVRSLLESYIQNEDGPEADTGEVSKEEETEEEAL